MNTTSLKTLIAAAIVILAQTPAYADTSLIDGIKSNPELSDFYQALQDTNVISELAADKNYMIFAPVNSQFEKALPERAKCLASEGCKREFTNIMRNHIVEKVMPLADAMQYKAGIFAVNNHFIPFTNAGAARITVEGQNIIETEKYDNGLLYTTDGVLMSETDHDVIVAAMTFSAPEVQKTSTTEKTTIPDPACGPEGCPDTKKTVTTIRKTITEISH